MRRQLVLLGKLPMSTAAALGEREEAAGKKETRQAEHAGEEEEMSVPSGQPPCHSCTYQPVEEVGHLHLGEVGGFYFWFLVRFGYGREKNSTYMGVR